VPLFAFIGRDGPRGLELRKLHRPAHLEHWSALVAAGRVRFGGPLLDERGEPTGSVLLFEAESAAAARAQAEADPYLTRGIFERFDLFETRQVLPECTDSAQPLG
jgi:uncharacterized protein YciI